ncbi:MAG: taurine dioxygenase [Acidimicrobiales bacterium]|nr:taurine dioxygenase [Acidimicrobiales bacterium]
MEIRVLNPVIGAEVTGIELGRATDKELKRVRNLLLEHLVLFFPGQPLDLDQHVALGRRFGELEVHPNLPKASDSHPEVVQLRADHGGIADEWHSDVTFLPHPSVLSIMQMVECPESGGDTMWANQYEAYAQLSAPLREMLDGLRALHDAHPHGKPEMQAVHPVVRIHPETGRRSLLVNEHFTRRIVELSHGESKTLLEYLTQWSVRPEFSVRYQWSPSTVAMWDNRCTQHCVVNAFDGQRVINRVTVLGDDPAGDPPRWEPAISTTYTAQSRFDRQLVSYLRAEQASEQPQPT